MTIAYGNDLFFRFCFRGLLTLSLLYPSIQILGIGKVPRIDRFARHSRILEDLVLHMPEEALKVFKALDTLGKGPPVLFSYWQSASQPLLLPVAVYALYPRSVWIEWLSISLSRL